MRSGEVEIVDNAGGKPKTIAVHRAGQFTGDVSHLTGTPGCGQRHRQAIYGSLRDYAGRFARDARPMPRLSATSFCRLSWLGGSCCANPETSPDFAWSVRDYSRDTFRIREFLAKNLVPFTWLDLERDPEVKRFSSVSAERS